MNAKLLLAGIILTGSQAMAADVVLPDVCKSVANYAAMALDQRFYEDNKIPKKIVLNQNYKNYPVGDVKDLGNCEDQIPGLKDSWCRVAGGAPEIYQVQVEQADKDGMSPFATVIVTYNRGGCWVDEIEKN